MDEMSLHLDFSNLNMLKQEGKALGVEETVQTGNMKIYGMQCIEKGKVSTKA